MDTTLLTLKVNGKEQHFNKLDIMLIDLIGANNENEEAYAHNMHKKINHFFDVSMKDVNESLEHLKKFKIVDFKKKPLDFGMWLPFKAKDIDGGKKVVEPPSAIILGIAVKQGVYKSMIDDFIRVWPSLNIK